MKKFLTHVFFVTDNFSAADLVPADFCKTYKNAWAKNWVYVRFYQIPNQRSVETRCSWIWYDLVLTHRILRIRSLESNLAGFYYLYSVFDQNSFLNNVSYFQIHPCLFSSFKLHNWGHTNIVCTTNKMKMIWYHRARHRLLQKTKLHFFGFFALSNRYWGHVFALSGNRFMG